MYASEEKMNRERRVHLRVNDAEYEAWIVIARSKDLPLSALIRRCMNALSAGLIEVPEVPKPDNKKRRA